jgi:hypothetical protein
MAEERLERRLAAILAADVAGYSRLIGDDEEGTHTALKRLLKSLVDPKIAQHRGHTVKNTGDGALVEFASAIDAVRCAVEIQRAMAELNADIPADRRIEFRLGINVGDIIFDEGDIYGDGVNIAWASSSSRTSPDPCGSTTYASTVHKRAQRSRCWINRRSAETRSRSIMSDLVTGDAG